MGDGTVALGWRGLSQKITARTGRTVGVGRVRWLVESSGLPIGRKEGNRLFFSEADIETTVRLLQGSR